MFALSVLPPKKGTCKWNDPLSVQTRAKYLSVGKSMKLFEDTKYEMWKEHVEQVLPSLLKRNLLIKPAVSAAMAMHASEVPEDTGDDVGKWRPMPWIFG